MALDFKRLGTLLGIVLTSHHDGEVMTALHQLRKTLKEGGAKYHVITDALLQHDPAVNLDELIAQREKLFEVAQELKIERDRLFDECERLRTLARPVMQKQAAAAAAKVKSAAATIRRQQVYHAMPQTVASRLLELNDDGDIQLTEFEEDFLGTVVNWRGALTIKQQQVMERITEKYEDDID